MIYLKSKGSKGAKCGLIRSSIRKGAKMSQGLRKAAKSKDLAKLHSKSSRACTSNARRCLLISPPYADFTFTVSLNSANY